MLGRELLRDVVVVLAASLPVLWICRRLSVPQIVGFLFTGVVAGPHALAWVHDAHRVEGIAELGVVLILFFVGLHFPLKRLARLGRTALVGGSLQIGLTVGAIALALAPLGIPPRTAVFYGILVSLSSTAVLLPILQARDEMAAPYSRSFLGVSLFQDLAVIPLVLLLPALSPERAATDPSTVQVLGRVGVAVLGVAALVAVARYLAPRALDGIVRLGSRESFTGGVVVLVLAMIAAAESAGVSAAMGAFAAGIVLGESEHVHEVAATLAPLRDILSSLFFVSVGMLLDPGFVARNALLVLSVVALVLLAKVATSFLALRVAAATPRTALRAALALAAVGEFSFVIAQAGRKLSLLTPDGQQVFVAVAVITMALSPLLVAVGPRLMQRLSEGVEGLAEEEPGGKPLRNHIVVVGYGLSGRSVARVLSETHIPHVVLDIQPERVAWARRDGSRALRADGTGREALLAAGVDRALGIVVTIPDADETRRTVRQARLLSPDVRILVRTRYVREVEALRRAGADEVIPEEFETSIEIVARSLRLLHIPGNVVATQIRVLRDETYRRLRDGLGRVTDGRRLSALMAAGTTELFLVMPDSPADGRTLEELRLEADHVVVPALLRDGVPVAPPPREERILAGDTLLLVGAHEDLAHVLKRLEPSTA